MILREAIQNVRGLRYMTEQLNIRSALGRRYLYALPWLKEAACVQLELERCSEMLAHLNDPAQADHCRDISDRLVQIRDIRTTIKHTGERLVLDDLELFELKFFAILAMELRRLTCGWTYVQMPDLERVVELLDPEGNRIPHFYIYDIYSSELAAIRKEMKQKKQQGAPEATIESLYFRSVELEDAVRAELSQVLWDCHESLEQALEAVALLDVTMAKAEQCRSMQLVRPDILSEDGITTFIGLFHPQLQEALAAEGKTFQQVDICLARETTLITGANMAGKTVLLKSIALAQYLMQFGFFVPAKQAGMVLVDEVQVSVGDEQDELNGLSSFAAEMLGMNRIIGRVRQGMRMLVLIDELARTTNPTEGRAIVNGMVDFLSEKKVTAVVTTHYGGIVAPCRKLRVRGFVENNIREQVSLKNINECIDYSLEEHNEDEVPHEAMRIAEWLGIDRDLLGKAEEYLIKKA